MSAPELATLWELKQEIAAMPEDDQRRVKICAVAIRQIINSNPGYGQLAFAWIGAELAADDVSAQSEASQTDGEATP